MHLSKNYKSEIETSTKFFEIVSIVNSLGFTELDSSVIAYISSKGSIKGVKDKEELCSYFGIKSIPSLNNILSKVKRKKFIIKDSQGYKVNPYFNNIDYKNLKLNLTFTYEE